MFSSVCMKKRAIHFACIYTYKCVGVCIHTLCVFLDHVKIEVFLSNLQFIKLKLGQLSLRRHTSGLEFHMTMKKKRVGGKFAVPIMNFRIKEIQSRIRCSIWSNFSKQFHLLPGMFFFFPDHWLPALVTFPWNKILQYNSLMPLNSTNRGIASSWLNVHATTSGESNIR